MIEQIGPHRVRQGSLMDDLEDLIPSYLRVNFFYCDPPWGPGNLKYWATINQKQTGQVTQPPPLDNFLERLFFLAASTTGDSSLIFLEYGLRWDYLIKSYIDRWGLVLLNRSTPVYGTPPRPLHLYTIGKDQRQIPAGYGSSIDGTTGMETLQRAVQPFIINKGMTIFDPCCGLGNTARLALEYRMTFFGNELNGARLDTLKNMLYHWQMKGGIL